MNGSPVMSTQLSRNDRDRLIRLHQAIRDILLQDGLHARLQIAAHTCRDLGWGYVGIVLLGDRTPAIELGPDEKANSNVQAISPSLLSEFWFGKYLTLFQKFRQCNGYLVQRAENGQ